MPVSRSDAGGELGMPSGGRVRSTVPRANPNITSRRLMLKANTMRSEPKLATTAQAKAKTQSKGGNDKGDPPCGAARQGHPCRAVKHQSVSKFTSDVCWPPNQVASNLKNPASSSNELAKVKSGYFTDMASMTGVAGDHAVSKLITASPSS